MKLSTSSFETKNLHNELKELKIDPPETKVTDVPIDNSSLIPNASVHATEQSHQGALAADS